MEVRPDVMLGDHPGYAHPRELILRRIEGASEDALLESYPNLTREDVRAEVAYAADEIAHLDLDLPESVELGRS